MTTTGALTPPHPVPDSDSAEYWAALAEHRITYQRCPSCGAKQIYFRAICQACWNPHLIIETSTGTGSVYSYTVLTSVGDPALARETPLVIALVDLDDGPRVLTRIEGDSNHVRIGTRVSPAFRDLDDGVTLLHFAVCENAAPPDGEPR
jgi:uncharacterized OB-fold protein